jgi:hypothetical protein
MSLHGIAPSPLPTSIRVCRALLADHLLSGSCCSTHSGSVCHLVATSVTGRSMLLSLLLKALSKCDSHKLPTDNMLLIASRLGITWQSNSSHVRREVCNKLAMLSTVWESTVSIDSTIGTFFHKFESLSLPNLRARCLLHDIRFSDRDSSERLRILLTKHFGTQSCSRSTGEHCLRFMSEVEDKDDLPAEYFGHFSALIDKHNPLKITLAPLRRLLHCLAISFDENSSLKHLRKLLKAYIDDHRKGKDPQCKTTLSYNLKVKERLEYNRLLNLKTNNWPELVSKDIKDSCINSYRSLTSSDVLKTFVCASCASLHLLTEKIVMSASDFDLNLLKRPDVRNPEIGVLPDRRWLSVDPMIIHPPMPFSNDLLADVLLDSEGVLDIASDNSDATFMFCKPCASALNNKKVPALALANRTYIGPIPDELENLTIVEESMISLCRAKCHIIKLREEHNAVDIPTTQRGIKGNVIVFPQRPSAIAKKLPPALDDITSPICILFIGSQPPTQEWLRLHAKPLAVRPAKVRSALMWLKHHNALYKDIEIDEGILNSLEDNAILDFQIEHILPNETNEVRTSRYDFNQSLDSESGFTDHTPSMRPPELSWESVVITDIDCLTNSNDMRSAAFRHVKNKGKGYIEISHDPEPVNEFWNPELFPKIYPSLFPYGIGGFEDPQREVPLSMKRHVKYLLNLKDRRFQEHYSFMFTVFNMLQRRQILLQTKLKTSKSTYNKVAQHFATIGSDVIHSVVERLEQKESLSHVWSDEEKKLHTLMREVNTVSGHVPGSSAARVEMRNEIRALMMDQGLPSFFVTINPADIYNPVVRVLAGEEIDIDNLLPDQVPKGKSDYWKQSILISKNPSVAARFFNVVMKAFISCLLKYDPNLKDLAGGVFGLTKAYYGCVEAQGRGTLHCHMLVWLHGGLNPNEIKQKILADPEFQRSLISFLEDCISNGIPDDPDPNLVVPSSRWHPCCVRGISPSATESDTLRQKDLHNLVKQCQWHEHSKTCYKYWRGPPEPKECRFDMHEDNAHPETMIDTETGEIRLRCLDGLVNNYNETIIEAIRCNMDVKFIGSGASAKAILYYITDYITKTQLKTHVAYAALELAVKKLGEFNPNDDDITLRAKKMLQKCSHALLTHQELSSQQVASYLLDLEDHFTSHTFAPLFWASFEHVLEVEQPSLECYEQPRLYSLDATDPEVESDTDDDYAENLHYAEPLSTFQNDDTQVVISFDKAGNVHASISPVTDYIHRGSDLSDINVWNFIARVKKVTKKSVESKKRRSKLAEQSDYQAEEEILDTDFTDLFPDMEDDYGSANSVDHIFNSIRFQRPKILFSDHREQSHPQEDTHLLYVLHPDKRRVPVPLGPAIPRRDRNEQRQRYSRLMLILFKPWRSADDLRKPGQSWSDAFEEFIVECPEEFKLKMNNMQMLHECRDSRDDHFANRRNKVQKHTSARSSQDSGDDFTGDDNAEDILNHLKDLKECFSDRQARSNLHVLDCLEYAGAGGMFSPPTTCYQPMQPTTVNANVSLVHEHVTEDKWKYEYEKRNEALKKRAATDAATLDTSLTYTTAVNFDNPYNDGSAFRNAFQVASILEPSIQRDIAGTDSESQDVDIEQVILDWTLNTEQARAFRIIANHSIAQSPMKEQLRMFLSGPGGTGKSRVIDAITDFFKRRKESRRIRLTSFTGIAARNIKGMTLHAALCMSQKSNSKRSKKNTQSTTNRDLISMWDGVDYLFIDEVSMVGCSLLNEISNALMDAKQNSLPFGGINIIFAGDFAQLPPVQDPPLYRLFDTTTMSATQRSQDVLAGKLLWLTVNTVVILTEVRRQEGKENIAFVQLLGRLRTGTCTDEDYQLLQTRILTEAKPNWSDPKMNNIRVIVSQNVIKDALNDRSAAAFAARTGQELHWYYAIDSRGGKEVTDPNLKRHLRNLPTTDTNQRLGKIPLVIGMPVMITQNFDVANGVVNGAIGTLKKIRYVENEIGERHAISCVVHVDSMAEDVTLSGLSSQEAAVLEDKVKMSFVHPYSHKRCTIDRTQLPIVPAFAMTAHKSQGQTIERVIIDLEACRGTESAYVMMSRAKSLDGLYILRPFNKKRLTTRPSQDTRTEFKRLKLLMLRTILEHGNEAERASAQRELAGLAVPQHSTIHVTPSPEDVCNPRLLARIQNNIVAHTGRVDLQNHVIHYDHHHDHFSLQLPHNPQNRENSTSTSSVGQTTVLSAFGHRQLSTDGGAESECTSDSDSDTSFFPSSSPMPTTSSPIPIPRTVLTPSCLLPSDIHIANSSISPSIPQKRPLAQPNPMHSDKRRRH